MADVIINLTPLPQPSDTSIPTLTSGTVVLYQDDNWGSPSFTLNVGDVPPGSRQRLQNSMFDSATWLAFNLPVGDVMTMMDNVQLDTAGKNVADLSGCGRSVDLVGNGQTHAVDLGQLGLNDALSTFFWRRVDFDLGAVELFDDADFQGNRSTIFLSEWSPNSIHSIQDWFLQDAITSVRWKALSDRQQMILFDNADGSGAQYNNIKGYGNTKELANFGDLDFNDTVTAFQWIPINPKKEIIAPFKINLDTMTGASGFTASGGQRNNSSIAQPFTVEIDRDDVQETSTTTSDQHVVGMTASYTSSVSEGAEGIETAKQEWSVSLNYEYTHVESHTRTDTQSIGLHINQTVTAKAHTLTKATILVNIGHIPATTYHTTAQRWYDVAVTDGTPDPANNNWYWRVEPVSVDITGSLAASWNVQIDETPLGKSVKEDNTSKTPHVASKAVRAEVS